MTFDLRRPTFDLRRPTFDLRRPTCDLRPATFDSGARAIRRILIVFALLGLSVGLAQERRAGDDRENGDLPPQVYLNDSFEAADALARAKTLAASGRWEQAARILQETAAASGDVLVRLSRDHFVGVRRHIQDLIASWPQPGLAAYRALYEEELTEAVAAGPQPRSAARLLSLFNRFFCTAAAARLADTIGQMAIEAGDLTMARRVYRRVLDQHPDRFRFEKRYRAMLALLDTMSGEEVDADAETAGITIRWMGEARPLSEVLGQIRESFTALPSLPMRTDWPMVGGETGRNRRGATEVDELGLLWRFDDIGRDRREADEEDREDPDERRPRPRELTMYPVVDEDMVYVQHYREVIAVHRNTGVPAWRFGSDEASPGGFTDFEEQPSVWHAPTVHEDRVFAVLPGDVVPFFGYESAQSPPELVCLRSKTGELLWPEDRECYMRILPEVAFDTSPIVDNGHVFVVGRRRRSFGFEDCYLFRFAAADGALEFQTHLGSASSGSFGSPRPTMSVAALKGDTVYVCTNLGSIAAVSAHTGAVRWLRLYDRDRPSQRRDTTWSARHINPWAFNPVIVTDDAVVAMPTDAARVFALDLQTGDERWSIPAEAMAQVEMILGVHDNLVCGVGKEAACYDLGTRSLRWSTQLPEGASPLGRGAWSGDRLLVATETALSLFAITDGQRTDLPWHSAGRGGNLLPLPGQLVVAGPRSVAAFVRQADIWNTLRQQMAARPADPTPALEFAEVAFRGGEYDKALSVLDEAVRRMERSADNDSEQLRRRFFSDAMMFAEVMHDESRLDAPTLEILYAYAARYPTDATGHLALRMQFAELFAAHGAPPSAIELYQQVLGDRSLRELDVPGAGAVKAGERAREKIAALIAQSGTTIYAPFEAQARRALELGKAGRDPAMLARVVDVFPNSAAAVEALIAHGDLMSETGHPGEAAAQWMRAYYRFPRKVEQPELIKKIADAYQQAGRPAHAYRWLTKGTREHPDVLLDYQGGLVTFAEYRERLADVREAVAPSRPSIQPPLNGAYERTFEASARLLHPSLADQPAGDWSRYHVQTEEGIRAFDTRTNRALWDHPVDTDGEATLLLATADLTVLATEEMLFGVDGMTGQVLWSFGGEIAELDDPLADWEEGRTFRGHGMVGNQLLSVRVNGEMICIDLKTGASIWSAAHDPPPGAAVHLGDPWVVYHGMKNGRVVLHLIHTSSGTAARTIETEETRPVEEVFVALDGQIIVITSQSLASFDGDSGTRRWSIELAAHLRRSSLLLDLDAVYFFEEDRRVRKISLENGATLWRSGPLPMAIADDVTVHRRGHQVIVSTISSVSGLDDGSGSLLWHGTTPEGVRFLHRFITRSFFAAVDVPQARQDDDGQPREADSVLYFYALSEGSGAIPREGGAMNLGNLADLRAILAADGAIIAQLGSTIRGWTE